MTVTDAISITELSKLLQKSRPTVYKYLTDFQAGNLEAVPYAVRELFRLIEEEELSHDEIVTYCHTRFGAGEGELSPLAKQAVDFIKAHQDEIDYERLFAALRKAIR